MPLLWLGRMRLLYCGWMANSLQRASCSRSKTCGKRRTLLRGIAFAEYKLSAKDANQDRLNVPTLLTVQAQQAMQPAPEPQYAGGHDPAKEQSLKWAAYYDALIEDAQVRFFS